MLKKLLAFIRSPKFFAAVVVLFVLQGIFFAIAVNPSDIYVLDDGTVTRGGGVVPDGNRHIGAIYYYAQQPILNGPVISDMRDSDLWMGDLERFPSYLYYYLMSLVIRIPIALDASDIVNVMIIRLLGLVIGVLALIAFRKVISEITSNKVVVNVATLALAITGSFAWLAPAENYDILALLFFFLFMLSSLRLFTRQEPQQLYWMLLWGFIGSITKYTYLPFMGLFGLVALVLFVRNNGGVKRAFVDVRQKITKLLTSVNKLAVVILSVILIIAGALFVERIGVNIAQYQSVSPSCDSIHSHEACMNFGVYERDYNREQLVESSEDTYIFDPVYFTGLWLFKYYTSMYAYVGHIWIEYFSPIMYTGLGIVLVGSILMTIYLKRQRIKIFDSLTTKYSLFVVAVLVISQYIYNALSFIKIGGVAYATQGRYLLPAIGFIYLLLLIVAAKFYRSLPATKKKRAAYLLVALAVIAIITNSAIPTFILHATSPEWFSWT